jgi:hypothetical protein
MWTSSDADGSSSRGFRILRAEVNEQVVHNANAGL